MDPQERPAGPSAVVPRIWRVKVTHPLTVLFLGPYRGHLEHWKGESETFPCDAPACKACDKGIRQDFYAYAAANVYDPSFRRWVPAVVQLTACAEELLRGRALRGTVWELRRAPGRGKLGKVSCRFLDSRDPGVVPEEFDVRPSLKVIWGERHFNLDVPNNRIVVEPQPEYEGAPPPGFEDRPLPERETSTSDDRRRKLEKSGIDPNSRVKLY